MPWIILWAEIAILAVSHCMKQDDPPQAAGAATHRSLERGLALLELVAAAQAPVPLAEAARRLGLHRSTAHHLMRTLVALGYLRQDEATRSYALTSRLHQLTGRRWNPAELGELAQPFLERVTAATGEGSSLACLIDGVVTIVAKRETDGPVRVVQNVGAERPLHCTAVGKALSAWLPAAELQAALARTPLQAYTAKTITTHEGLQAELRRVRNAGYAIDDEEQHEGLRCIAMPVHDRSGEVVAAMCVLGPRHRMTHQKLLAVRGPLQAQSTRLSQRLGHGDPA